VLKLTLSKKNFYINTPFLIQIARFASRNE